MHLSVETIESIGSLQPWEKATPLPARVIRDLGNNLLATSEAARKALASGLATLEQERIVFERCDREWIVTMSDKTGQLIHSLHVLANAQEAYLVHNGDENYLAIKPGAEEQQSAESDAIVGDEALEVSNLINDAVRSPLTPVRGCTQLLTRRYNHPVIQAAGQRIINAVDVMTASVEQIYGRNEFHAQPTDRVLASSFRMPAPTSS